MVFFSYKKKLYHGGKFCNISWKCSRVDLYLIIPLIYSAAIRMLFSVPYKSCISLSCPQSAAAVIACKLKYSLLPSWYLIYSIVLRGEGTSCAGSWRSSFRQEELQLGGEEGPVAPCYVDWNVPGWLLRGGPYGSSGLGCVMWALGQKTYTARESELGLRLPHLFCLWGGSVC